MPIAAFFTIMNAVVLTGLIWVLRKQASELGQMLLGIVIMFIPVVVLVALIFVLGFAGFTIGVYFSVVLLAVGIVLFQRFKQQHLARVLGGAITLWLANAVHGVMLFNFWLLLQEYA